MQGSGQKAGHRIFILLFFISFVTFHSEVFADTKQKIAEQYRAQGYAQQQKGNWYDALTYYDKAIALGLEYDAVVFNDMGVLYEQVGLPAKAEYCYLQAIWTNKDYLPPYANLGYLYFKKGEKEKAFLYFRERYESADPSDPWAQKIQEELLNIHPEYQQRILAREAQRLDEELMKRAREDFARRVERASEHYRKGRQIFQDKNYMSAIEEFNKALKLTPQDPRVMRAREQALRELRKERLREYSDQAIRSLDSGDSFSARNEIRKMLTTVPNEPVLTP
ncbi:MAG: hypothetical protein A3G91_06085 [Omnitrophica WOR_2 bacterium RIFCSPLOWO2_12_FULL_50_9]|nr:MAG: hypothetical protein A3D87_09030 [Omnitrophica WOR_2 bacterium RIFCSPHIGHO2_02_FULL_50_17]OGX43006.1 MAG: hypothetical protein A3G91_06085 [Omnitrophica WOR_2 bacterium RIFCSPLOWO2_12_FULL_50_9]